MGFAVYLSQCYNVGTTEYLIVQGCGVRKRTAHPGAAKRPRWFLTPIWVVEIAEAIGATSNASTVWTSQSLPLHIHAQTKPLRAGMRMSIPGGFSVFRSKEGGRNGEIKDLAGSRE